MRLTHEIDLACAPMYGQRKACMGTPTRTIMSVRLPISLDSDLLKAGCDVIPFRKVRDQVRTARYYAWTPQDTTDLLSTLEHAQRKLRNIKRLLGEIDEPVGPRAA
jgi:hypothetical protein